MSSLETPLFPGVVTENKYLSDIELGVDERRSCHKVMSANNRLVDDLSKIPEEETVILSVVQLMGAIDDAIPIGDVSSVVLSTWRLANCLGYYSGTDMDKDGMVTIATSMLCDSISSTVRNPVDLSELSDGMVSVRSILGLVNTDNMTYIEKANNRSRLVDLNEEFLNDAKDIVYADFENHNDGSTKKHSVIEVVSLGVSSELGSAALYHCIKREAFRRYGKLIMSNGVLFDRDQPDDEALSVAIRSDPHLLQRPLETIGVDRDDRTFKVYVTAYKRDVQQLMDLRPTVSGDYVVVDLTAQ